MTTESFAPTVLVDGRTVAPPGWMWLLGYALAGCAWAVRECETDAWKDQAREWFRARDRHHVEDEIAALEARVARLKEQL